MNTKNIEEYQPAVITEIEKQCYLFCVRTFEQRHCFLYSPDLIANLMRLSNEYNNNNTCFVVVIDNKLILAAKKLTYNNNTTIYLLCY